MSDKFVPLSVEETLHAVRLAKDGDENSKEKLLNGHFPLIKSVVKGFVGRGVDYEDLYQLGVLGFLKAIRNFDEKYDVKFSTYSVPMIAGEIKRFLRDDGTIKVSRAIKQLAAKAKAFIEEYMFKNNENPSVEVIAKNLGESEEDVVFALDSAKSVISLNAKIDENDENSSDILDRLLVDDENDNIIDRIQLLDSIKKLDSRDRKLIMLRYYRGKTQSEIAEMLGVSQVQVSRIESKILEQLKKEIK